MFRTFFQLGEWGQGVTRLGIAWVVHLDEDGLISLHDKRIGRIVLHLGSTSPKEKPAAARRRGENGSVLGCAKACKAGLWTGDLTFADGSVHVLLVTVKYWVVSSLVTKAGGETFNDDDL